jgi:hypothetical protein
MTSQFISLQRSAFSFVAAIAVSTLLLAATVPTAFIA